MKKHDNFASNLAVLRGASGQDLSNEFVESGVINKFFLQFELSWKLLKETLAYEGVADVASGSPRQIIKSAYAYYDFIDEEAWLGMLAARNNLAHRYDAAAAARLARAVVEEYVPAFERLDAALDELYGGILW